VHLLPAQPLPGRPGPGSVCGLRYLPARRLLHHLERPHSLDAGGEGRWGPAVREQGVGVGGKGVCWGAGLEAEAAGSIGSAMCSGPRGKELLEPSAVQHLETQHCWHAPPAALLQDPLTLDEVDGWVDCMTPGVKADLTGTAAGTACFLV
jgi:hypothetical protein